MPETKPVYDANLDPAMQNACFKAERHGDRTDPFTQVKNLARARIIVK